MDCFFCATPYQIIVSMSIAKASKEKSDLYIIPRFENANDLARKIASKYIFRRVKVVNKALVDRIFKYDTKSKFSYNLHLIYRYLRINSFAKKNDRRKHKI